MQPLLFVLLVCCIQLAWCLDVQTVRVVQRHPHDPLAFTEGLCVLPSPSSSTSSLPSSPLLLESTGIWGASTLRLVDIDTGRVLHQLHINSTQFGEGVAISPSPSPHSLIQLTYQNHTAYTYPLADLLPPYNSSSNASPDSSFLYPPFIDEGWGLASSTSSPLLRMSDGSSFLHSFHPPFHYSHSTVVHLVPHSSHSRHSTPIPITGLNELEVVHDEVWANVYGTRCIARIEQDGSVRSVVRVGGEKNGLYEGNHPSVEVMNGIAWDERTGRLWITGKLWPWLYEVEVMKGTTAGEDETTTEVEQFRAACPTSDFTAEDERYQAQMMRNIQQHIATQIHHDQQ